VNQQARTAVIEGIRDFCRGEASIERHKYGADLRGGHEGDEKVGVVLAEVSDPGTTGYVCSAERVRKSVYLPEELIVGGGNVVENECRLASRLNPTSGCPRPNALIFH
jgi:hypothetical protein